MTRPDPRARRHPFAAPQDAAAAAAALEAAAESMRAEQLQRGGPIDEPPTGLLDLAAIRAALGAPAPDANPAAVRWLNNEPEPEPIEDVLAELAGDPREPEPEPEWPVPPVAACHCPMDANTGAMGRAPLCPLHGYVDDTPTQVPLDWPCERLGNAVHSDGPCGPQHVTIPLDEPAPVAVTPPPVFHSEHRALTWRSRHDERSRNFGVRGALRGSAPVSDRLWPVGAVLDQGPEGACVGFGIVDALNAAAAGDTDRTAGDAVQLYRLAQRLDELPGEDYAGTSVLAGMKAAQSLGWIGGYRWAFGTRDVAQAVLQAGPVVVGVPWPEAWFDAPADGLLSLAGVRFGGLGHCLAVVGLTVRGPQQQLGPFFVLQGSYGPGWGDRGLVYLHHRDLAALLHGTGEAAVPVPVPA